jgi:hypothetical protein
LPEALPIGRSGEQELTPKRVVVRDPPGHLAAAQALEDMRDEVERSGTLAVGQALQQGRAVRLGEPRELVVEVPGLIVIEDRPRDPVQLGRRPQARGDERFVERITDPVQVEVPEHDQVRVPASFPPEWLQDPEIQDFVVSATRGIAATRRALAIVKGGAQGMDYVAGNVLNFDPSATQDEWMNRVNKVDRARNQILKAANELVVRNNLQPCPEIALSFSPADIQQARARAGRR